MAKQRRNEKGLGHKKSDWGEKEKGTNLVTWRWRVSEEVWRRFQRQKEGEERKRWERRREVGERKGEVPLGKSHREPIK